MSMRSSLYDTSLTIPFHERGRRSFLERTHEFACVNGINTQLLQDIQQVEVVISGKDGINILGVDFGILGGVGLIEGLSG